MDGKELKQRSWPCRVARGDHYQPPTESSSWHTHSKPRKKSEVQQALLCLIQTVGWQTDLFAARGSLSALG